MMKKTVHLDGHHLTMEEVALVACREADVSWRPLSRRAVEEARRLVESFVAKNEAVYGVTTGFGKLSDVKINRSQLEQLQANLIRSHACGTGPSLTDAETRAAMLIRANVLAKGFSGVRPVVVETLVAMLNADLLPVIPAKGSVGASGDLAPSAHIALVLMGEGRARYGGEELDGGEAMTRAGIPVVTFQAKEGLAVLNGTQIMAALGCLLLFELEYLLHMASLAAALSTDGLKDTDRHFDPQVHAVRPHPGQQEIAREMAALLRDSEIRESHRMCGRVQDPYSLRCIPQVHGAVRDTMVHARAVLEREINSATDNPLVFPQSGEVISGGNFHGEPLAFILDFLAIAATELTTIAERRIELLINPDLSGLPAFLAMDPGLNSGFMIAQLTVVSLVAENRILAHPASVDTLPTSANKEDHVSMGMTAALKLRQIVENVRTVLAVELLVACQAIDFRRPLQSSPALEKVYGLIRRQVPFMDVDRNISRDIAIVNDMLRDRLIKIPRT
ncbi:MAG: histidine ammonia-lyase [Acidobacteria bacterium]|nr:histidine ammonia-lyase [Acidobacteriota bacterium]